MVGSHVHIYGAAALAVLAVRIILVFLNRPPTRRARPLESYSVVVPVYNEKPETLARCLNSILAQLHRPLVVTVVDDGSAVPVDTTLAARAFERLGIHFEHVRHPTNLGKREAIAVGLRRSGWARVLVCVDSDTVLAETACARLVAPFADPTTMVATGLVTARNRASSLLTRLIDIRYTAAMEFERASQSALGAMVCACGSLAAYRADMVHRNLDDFLGQTFMGRRCTIGDDRRLTAYGLRAGKTYYVRSARAWTDVPETFPQWAVQQARWTRSWTRESMFAMRELPASSWGRVMVSAEVALTGAFTAALGWALLSGNATRSLLYLGILAGIAALRSMAYLARWDLPLSARLSGVLLAPLYSAMALAVLPVRAWAAATAARSDWGTRNPPSEMA
mgnify:CR=1 FL=1